MQIRRIATLPRESERQRDSRDNDMAKDIIDYRMRVHVFGNSPSPAVAVYGLRKAVREAEAIDLLQRTQASLSDSNLRLHKFISNHQAVMGAFPPQDCVAGIENLDLGGEITTMQRSLGLCWELVSDTFTFAVSTSDKLFTRHGVLSTVNSLFDPLGLVAPVTIQGRALLRDLMADMSDWDMPLPEEKLHKWETWRNSLQDLKQLSVPHTYTSISLCKATYTELCVFSDSSMRAIGAVAYLRAKYEDGRMNVGFVLGKARLTPLSEPTIPRLELCVTVLAVEMAELIQEELDLKLDATRFYCDSKVVLGYIYNETRFSYVYVHNRVQRIHQSTKPEQWSYIYTEENPADYVSRSVLASCLAHTTWFTGPTFLHRLPKDDPATEETFELVSPEKDRDSALSEQFNYKDSGEKSYSQMFPVFLQLEVTIRATAFLIHITRSHKHSKQPNRCKGWHCCNLPRTPDELSQAKDVIIRAAQREASPKDFMLGTVAKDSTLLKLSPSLENNLISVGGRLKHAYLDTGEKNPLILSKHSHISVQLIPHYHDQVKHLSSPDRRSHQSSRVVDHRGNLDYKMDSRGLQNYLSQQGCTWEFNPPHASHVGGSWEHMIWVT
eukprot:superscaffoldBa00001412_g10420